MAVPEAAVHEHGRPVFREYQVRAARKVPDVQTEAKSFRVEVAPDDELRARIPAADSRHHPASGAGINYICHYESESG